MCKPPKEKHPTAMPCACVLSYSTDVKINTSENESIPVYIQKYKKDSLKLPNCNQYQPAPLLTSTVIIKTVG